MISGVASALPARTLSSAEIDAREGFAPGWLERSCGVRNRTVVSGEETQEGLAAAAGRAALADAELDLDDIDLVLFGAAVGRQPIPATAPLIQQMMGFARPIPAYDVNATCLSALIAMDVAALHIAAGRARHVLVVTSEIATRALPWSDDPGTAGLFGDGAAALVVSAASAATAPILRLQRVHLETWGQGYDLCALPAGGTRYDFHAEPDSFAANAHFRMEGHGLFRLTSERLPDFVERALAASGWRTSDVDLVVPHQASPLALAHMVKRCGFPAERVVNTVAETGNLVAASIPITLQTARQQKRLTPGAKVLMVGTSAGVSFGAALLTA